MTLTFNNTVTTTEKKEVQIKLPSFFMHVSGKFSFAIYSEDFGIRIRNYYSLNESQVSVCKGKDVIDEPFEQLLPITEEAFQEELFNITRQLNYIPEKEIHHLNPVSHD